MGPSGLTFSKPPGDSNSYLALDPLPNTQFGRLQLKGGSVLLGRSLNPKDNPQGRKEEMKGAAGGGEINKSSSHVLCFL